MPAMVIPLEDGVRPQCLDDWETYSRLQGQLIFVKKFWYLAVAVPLVLLGGFSTRFFRSLRPLKALHLASLSFGFLPYSHIHLEFRFVTFSSDAPIVDGALVPAFPVVPAVYPERGMHRHSTSNFR